MEEVEKEEKSFELKTRDNKQQSHRGRSEGEEGSFPLVFLSSRSDPRSSFEVAQ